MKLLFDLFPIALFVAAYFLSDIYVATGVLIAATLVQVIWLKLRDGSVPSIHLVTLLLLLLFGGLTIALQDPLFVKWKPTVVNWLFAAAFLASHFIGERPLIERMMSHAITVPGPVWLKLNWAWTLFFVAMGVLNLYVAYNYSEDTWVNFKLFGMMGLTIAFVFMQAFYLSRYMEEPAENKQESD